MIGCCDEYARLGCCLDQVFALRHKPLELSWPSRPAFDRSPTCHLGLRGLPPPSLKGSQCCSDIFPKPGFRSVRLTFENPLPIRLYMITRARYLPVMSQPSSTDLRSTASEFRTVALSLHPKPLDAHMQSTTAILLLQIQHDDSTPPVPASLQSRLASTLFYGPVPSCKADRKSLFGTVHLVQQQVSSSSEQRT